MSTLYLAADPRALADVLAEQLDHQSRTGDFFAPATIVVPNHSVRKWLRLWLARRLDVAINLQFQILEKALWILLKQVDPRRADPPGEVDENIYRLMVLSVLLEDPHPDLAPLRSYIQLDGNALSRLTCRRAWHLADRLGTLVRDYEYDRQDDLIQHWLKHRLGLSSSTGFHHAMEKAQRALFDAITRDPGGKRALYGVREGTSYKTFPQYAMELMTTDSLQTLAPAESVVYFFGFARVNELHARVIGWLGQRFDIRFFCPTVFAGRKSERVEAVAQSDHAGETTDPGIDVLSRWGLAGTESMSLLAHLNFPTEWLAAYEPARKAKPKLSVLARFRSLLLEGGSSKVRGPQDDTLQIVACPGVEREVETVYNSIIHNLQKDSNLRQTDIAIIVTDMAKYRAPLQAAFERSPQWLQYNMADYSAAGVSMFGQALLGMLDLALESFSRARVFQVILNPCYLARLGVDRLQAIDWLDWAEQLGIYQGWDADEKSEQGYARSPFYAWRLGLQRLRLGKFMDAGENLYGEPITRFGNVIPFADIDSSDREHLDAFCRAIEGLLPILTQFRSRKMSGKSWASQLERLTREFLEVPEDRPEEAQVRDRLVESLKNLEAWDSLREGTRKAAPMPLALVREYVQSQLESLPGNKGEFLVGGVTISALQPMRTLPFSVVYLLGLAEDIFPGSNALSPFDLRTAHRRPGDVRPAEQRIYDFLATALSAQQKLYLLYNSHDLRKDQAIQPSPPLQQLKRFLSDHVVSAPFETTTMPAHADDVAFLDAAKQGSHQDVIVQFREADRRLALMAAEREGRWAPGDLNQYAEWAELKCAGQVQFKVEANPPPQEAKVIQVRLNELKQFLELPALASMRRHLGIGDDDDDAELEDNEPLVTSDSIARTMIRDALRQLILCGTRDGSAAALAGWRQRFAETYAEQRMRSKVPEEAFGAIDQAVLLESLHDRIHGTGAIEAFLCDRDAMTFCGPVLLGTSPTPLGARLRFPVLRLPQTNARDEVRISGWTNLAWHAPGRFEMLVLTTSKGIDGQALHRTLLEPALVHLALLANGEPNAEGISSSEWLSSRTVALHVAHANGICTWTYAPGCITTEDARNWFVELARDFLDPDQFDLLPLEVICRKRLRSVLHGDRKCLITPDAFREMLKEELEENSAGGGDHERYTVPAIVQIAGAEIPADALTKLQTRFHLLDRGPARIRQGGFRPPLATKNAKRHAARRPVHP